jgi:hemerythrin-like domain-containing protein
MNELESPIKILKDEHQIILKVINVFDTVIKNDEEKLDYDGIEKCVDFFSLFADACHHCKEEDILFPELESKGIPNEGGPIGMMIHEHKIARSLIKKMKESLPEAKKRRDKERKILIESGHSYIKLLRDHISKEDQCLFTMADDVLDPPACKKLCSKYSKTSNNFDGNTKDQLKDLAKSLADKYN